MSTCRFLDNCAQSVREKINGLEGIIKSDYLLMQQHARSSVEYAIQVGRHLQQARDVFPGDRQFGEWRNETLPHIPSRTASALMAVARKFEDNTAAIEYLEISQLMELASADDELVNKIINRAKEGDSPTIKEIREIKKIAKALPASPSASDPEPVSQAPRTVRAPFSASRAAPDTPDDGPRERWVMVTISESDAKALRDLLESQEKWESVYEMICEALEDE